MVQALFSIPQNPLVRNKNRRIFGMLEKILLEVCQQMSDVLNEEQLCKLKNVLFINFHEKIIVEEKREIIPTEKDTDMAQLQMFVTAKKIAGRKDNTLKAYVSELIYFRNTINKRLEDVTTMDIRWYLGIMQQRGDKISTIQNKIRYLNSFYTFLVSEEIITKNPLARIETPKMDTVIRKPFSNLDMEAMRKACENPRERALIEFLYSTGLRVSEVCSLNVSDLDMYKKEFTVIGKGSKERIVYFSDPAYFHLTEYLNWRIEKEGLTFDELYNKPLFVTSAKPYNRMSKGSIRSLLKKISKKSGIANVHPHRFRRTFATNMMNKDMRLEDLAKLMGHSKIETTLIYCDIQQENVKNSYRKCA